MERDFYQVLGVARTAEPAEIRATYVRLVRRHHPDVSGNLPSRLCNVQAAYRCLADPASRADHDRHIAERERAHRARQRLVQRRLGRDDGSHTVLWKRDSRRWRPILIVAIGIGVAARLSMLLF